MQIDNRLIQKETIYFTNNGFKLSDVNYEAVKEAVDSHSIQVRLKIFFLAKIRAF